MDLLEFANHCGNMEKFGLFEAFSLTMDFLVKNCQLFFSVILLQGLGNMPVRCSGR
jgi:hypothetical protein